MNAAVAMCATAAAVIALLIAERKQEVLRDPEIGPTVTDKQGAEKTVLTVHRRIDRHRAGDDGRTDDHVAKTDEYCGTASDQERPLQKQVGEVSAPLNGLVNR
jgi:hypothetical protein